MTLEKFIDQVDDIYSRFTASTIDSMRVFNKELAALGDRAEEELPDRHKRIAELAMNLREKQMEKEIAKASDDSPFEIGEVTQ
jgi:hypothetical protein